MSELFNIFGDSLMNEPTQNTAREPLFNNENMGKSFSTDPIKCNEPLKQGTEPKKSFLCNTGKALQSTSKPQACTPRAVDIGALIYNDPDAESDNDVNFEELEFTKPVYEYDNYNKDWIDYLLPPEPEFRSPRPPRTPPPKIELMDPTSLNDDNMSLDRLPIINDSLPYLNESDLGLPDLY